jgi:hypothetical protein
MDQARLDGPTKVGRIDPFHCCADGVDLQEITDDDLGTQLLQHCGTFVHAVHQGANLKPEGKRLLNGSAAGVSSCACDQYCACHNLLLLVMCRMEDRLICCLE